MNKKILLSLALLSTLSAVDKFKAGDIISADVMNEAFDSITRVPTTADLVGSWSCKAIVQTDTGCTSSWLSHPDGLYSYLESGTLEITDDNDGTYSIQTTNPNILYCRLGTAVSGSIATEEDLLYINIPTDDIGTDSKRQQQYSLSLKTKNNFRFSNLWSNGSMNGMLNSANCQRVESIPNNPQELTVTVSSYRNTLNWSDLSTSETEFNILRKDSTNGEWQLIDTVNQNTTIYEDTVTEVKPYWYRVQAKNTIGTSLGSNVAATIGNGTVTLTSTDVKSAIDNAVDNTVTLSDTDIISTINTAVSTAVTNAVANIVEDPYADSTYDPYADSTYDPYADSTSE